MENDFLRLGRVLAVRWHAVLLLVGICMAWISVALFPKPIDACAEGGDAECESSFLEKVRSSLVAVSSRHRDRISADTW